MCLLLALSMFYYASLKSECVKCKLETVLQLLVDGYFKGTLLSKPAGQVEPVCGLIYLSLRSNCSTEMKKGEQGKISYSTKSCCCSHLSSFSSHSLSQFTEQFGNIHSTDRCAMLMSSSSNTAAVDFAPRPHLLQSVTKTPSKGLFSPDLTLHSKHMQFYVLFDSFCRC